MLCPPFFYLEIDEVKIRTTNPQFFCQCEKVSFIAVIYTARSNVKFWIRLANLQFPRLHIILDWQKQCKF